MRSVSIKLRFKIDKYRTTRGELIIGDSRLKFCVTLVHFGIECGGIKFFSGNSKLIDKGEMKTAETFDGSIASGFGESRRAATRDENRSSTEESISRVKRRIHMAVLCGRSWAESSSAVKTGTAPFSTGPKSIELMSIFTDWDLQSSLGWCCSHWERQMQQRS